ncbi:23142_t:CDS:2, partial [Racocetra persica]
MSFSKVRSGPEEICLPITDKDKQLFQELITDQKEMIDIVINEYRFLLHHGHNYKGGKLIYIIKVLAHIEKCFKDLSLAPVII